MNEGKNNEQSMRKKN